MAESMQQGCDSVSSRRDNHRTPSKSISDQWTAVEFVTRGKKVVAGVIVSETADKVVVQPVGAPPVTLAVKDIQSGAAAKVSPMPGGC